MLIGDQELADFINDLMPEKIKKTHSLSDEGEQIRFVVGYLEMKQQVQFEYATCVIQFQSGIVMLD